MTALSVQLAVRDGKLVERQIGHYQKRKRHSGDCGTQLCNTYSPSVLPGRFTCVDKSLHDSSVANGPL
jgi:hypothetical protein